MLQLRSEFPACRRNALRGQNLRTDGYWNGRVRLRRIYSLIQNYAIIAHRESILT